jgi:hypothetical protein
MATNAKINVTLDIFSGRPNPSWRIPDEKTKEFYELPGWKEMMVPEIAESQLGLGYRGFIITQASDDATPEIPYRLRIMGPSKSAHPLSTAVTLRSALEPKDMTENENWLLNTAGDLISNDLKESVQNLISQKGAGKMNSSSAKSTQARAGLVCEIKNISYNPSFWNQPSVQPYNNCYNYASNEQTDSRAQPGTASGHPNNIMQCTEVGIGADYDGCRTDCSTPFTQYDEVALVIWPGQDFHWYRKSIEGFWGHKPGQLPVRNVDNSGLPKTIYDPETCDRGAYTEFCGYRYCPKGMKVA